MILRLSSIGYAAVSFAAALCFGPAAVASDPECGLAASVVDVKRKETMILELPEEVLANTPEDARPRLRKHALLPVGSVIKFDHEVKDAWIELQRSPDSMSEVLPPREFSKGYFYPIESNCDEGPSLPKKAVMMARLFTSAISKGFSPDIASGTRLMGPQRSSDGDESKCAPEFTRLPEGTYKIEAAQNALFAAWSGSPGKLVLLDPASGREISRGNGAGKILLPRASDAMAFDLLVEALNGSRSSPRRIEIVPEGSAPDPMDSKVPASDALRAALLYYEGPLTWRLQALAELERFRDTSLIALKAWKDAVSDDVR